MRDTGLLILRVGAGLLMASHGLGKVQQIIAGDMSFPDPIGIGAAPSLILAAFAEFICALAVVLGFKTRFAAIPVAFTMLVGAFIVHANDGWEKQEFPLLYAIVFLALVFTNSGKYSLDAKLKKK